MRQSLKIFVVSGIHHLRQLDVPELDPKETDVVLTLGDIEPEAVDYILMRSGRVPVYGILGDRDPAFIPGLNNLHLASATVKGLRVGGFSGALKHKDLPNHFRPWQTWWKMLRMPPVDLFISHAPPFALSASGDLTHQGFSSVDRYVERTKPRHWLYSGFSSSDRARIGETQIHGVSGKAYQQLDFEIPDGKTADA